MSRLPACHCASPARDLAWADPRRRWLRGFTRIAARKTRDDKSISHQKYYIQKNYLLQLCNTTLKKLHEE
jgi:hypothetical protein